MPFVWEAAKFLYCFLISSIWTIKLLSQHPQTIFPSFTLSKMLTSTYYRGQQTLAHEAKHSNLQGRQWSFCVTLLLLPLSPFSCVRPCDPTDGSPPGSPVPGILQARTLEWVAISFSNAWKWEVKVKSLSRVRPSATPWTVAFQAPPSIGFSRQEYWSGVPSPSLSV